MKIPNPILVTVIIVIIFQIKLQAQAPGYLGKRTTLEVSGNFQFSVLMPNKKGSSYEGTTEFAENNLSFNTTLKINSNYAISRTNAVGIKYQRATTGAIFDTNLNNGNWLLSLSRVGIQRLSFTYSSFKMKKASLAPLGRSFYVALGGVRINSKELITKDRYVEVSPLDEIYPDLKTNISAIDIGVGWTRRWLVFDNVFLKTGFHFNAMISPKKFFYFYGDDSYNHPDYETNPVQASYETAVLHRTLRHNAFNFELGLGAVLF